MGTGQHLARLAVHDRTGERAAVGVGREAGRREGADDHVLPRPEPFGAEVAAAQEHPQRFFRVVAHVLPGDGFALDEPLREHDIHVRL